VQILCHRGAGELFHENTLEAYRASLELGADGNEIDIRATSDGVLVCFHDDMLDRLLWGFGDVESLPWDALRRLPFRNPGRLAADCRIPTLEEVLALHRQHAGLLHLDIKRPGLEQPIIELLDRLQMWEHVVHCNRDHSERILADPRLRLGRYKGSLYQDRAEVFPDAIRAMLEKPGDSLIVDDPRGVMRVLGRQQGPVISRPIKPHAEGARDLDATRLEPEEIVRGLRDAADWNKPGAPDSDEQRAAHIVRRARLADEVLRHRTVTKEIREALSERVRNRSLHRHWLVHGLDGAIALRSLLQLRMPDAVEIARAALWRDDPALEPVVNRQFQNPRAWTDFRLKMVVFPALAECPGAPSELLCRDYLALSDRDATQLGPALFEDAARALLAISPNTTTAQELLRHRLPAVRGRTILDCLARIDEPWTKSALQADAPFALDYVVRWDE
jgi:hypothetical protein